MHRYQGEHDIARHPEYECAFPRLIQRWRSIFRVPDAFFAFVRLAPWCDGAALPHMRDAQMSALMLSAVGYAPADDLGDPDDVCNVHPPDKRSVGERLARVALALGGMSEQEVHWRSPEAEAVEVLDDAVCVHARHVASHLYVREHTPTCEGGACVFSRELDDWRPAELFVRDRATVCFRASASEGVSLLQYGRRDVPHLVVYDNATELPLLPFERALY